MRKNLLFLLIFFFVFWFAFLGLSGTLTSGFHLTDDHQILYFVDKVKDAGPITTGVKWIGEDIGKYGRFLPVYYMHRMFQIKFFGSDFFIWGVYNALLTSSASFLFSASFLVLGFTLFEALVFPLFLYLGFQSAIIWRFGTAETLGLPILSVMLLLIALSARKRSFLKDALFIATGIVMMLTKESFLVLIPAVLFLKVWLERQATQKGWAETAKKNAFPIIVLLACVGALVLFIKFYMKTMGIGYAGYYGFEWGPVRNALKTYIRTTQAWLILAGGAFAWAAWSGTKRRLASELLPALVFFVLALLPEALLHARSGVYERYILPGAFGTAFVVLYLLRLVRENTKMGPARSRHAGWAAAALLVFAGASIMKQSGYTFFSYNVATAAWTSPELLSTAVNWLHGPQGRAVSHTIVLALLLAGAAPSKALSFRGPSQKTFFAVMLLWTLLFNFSIAYDNASRAAFDGHSTNEWLESIKENTEKDGAIIIAADPALNFEWAFSVKRYFEFEAGRKNIFTYPVLTKKDYDPFQKELIEKFSGLYKGFLFQGAKDQNVQAFAIFPGAEQQFLVDAATWFDKDKFTRYANGYGYVSYYRKAAR